MDPDRYRCAGVDQGIRCQLLAADHEAHAAMTGFDLSPERGKRQQAAATYRTWGEPWTGDRPGEGSLRWSPTMPRVEPVR